MTLACVRMVVGGLILMTMYEAAKRMIIPSQCLSRYFAKHKVFNSWVHTSLVILTVGVALSTKAELNWQEIIADAPAALHTVVTVVTEQAEIGRLKEKLEIDFMELLLSNRLHCIIMAGVLVLV
eukprot:6459612-Karenia_brevis.AAC.1